MDLEEQTVPSFDFLPADIHTFDLSLLEFASEEGTVPSPSWAAAEAWHSLSPPFSPYREEEGKEEKVELASDLHDFEPFFMQAMEEARAEVNAVCISLSLSPSPGDWTVSEAEAWIAHATAAEGAVHSTQWGLDGQALLALAEEQWTLREPLIGHRLFARFDLWKTVTTKEQESPMHTDEESETEGGGVRRRKKAAAHIHLWQFLKELLGQPAAHGGCIRWLDEPRGVFKIEDSVRVARLWGIRKNRPAMNYDKLSRSIRQYYRKGIMRKTERSQRLVYQFCHPYGR